MGFSILKYGRPLIIDIESLDEAKEKALNFVTSTQTDHIEIRDSNNETVTIGYFDGRRFHWTKDKCQTEAWKEFSFVTKPTVQSDCLKGGEKRWEST
jgi:hypothetical protein